MKNSIILKDVVDAFCATTKRPADTLARLSYWVEAFGDKPLTEITTDDVDLALGQHRRRCGHPGAT